MSKPTIFFSEPGSSCDIYSFGFTSGCTDENNEYRGFTQEWYFDDLLGVWMSLSPEHQIPVGDTGDFYIYGGESGLSLTQSIKVTGDRIQFETDFSQKIKGQSNSLATDQTINVSFADSNIHYFNFSADGSGGITFNFIQPPPNNYYGEIKLIIKNPSYADYLDMTGEDVTSSSSTVIMDGPGTDTYSIGTYMWTVWTLDGGANYYVYRTNGFGRYWNG